MLIEILFAALLAHAATIADVDLQRPEGARHYLLANAEGGGADKRPLVILLHGHGGSADQLLGRKHTAAPMAVWLDIAAREGLLIVAADGLRGADGLQGWNDCREADANPQADDVAFLDAIIAREVAGHRADPARVFVMGMSNGGMMTLRYAIEAHAKVAGFAAVSASMSAGGPCAAPKQALSALIIAGTADPLVPYGGGEVANRTRYKHGKVIGIEKVVDRWRESAGLGSATPSVTEIEHRSPSDPTRATRSVWGNDARQPQVELLRIEGGGHAEPSIVHRLGGVYARFVGPQNGDVEVAEEAWAFFRTKSR